MKSKYYKYIPILPIKSQTPINSKGIRDERCGIRVLMINYPSSLRAQPSSLKISDFHILNFLWILSFGFPLGFGF
jgi:hypothetical protein